MDEFILKQYNNRYSIQKSKKFYLIIKASNVTEMERGGYDETQ